MPFEPGLQVNDYEILEKLGQGGMGVVYKARNTLSDRIEVLKVLLPSLTETPELTDRFLREIKVTASLTHPNIAGFYTAQRIEGQVVMVLEYVPGATLTEIFGRGRLPLAQALDLAGQALSALGFAHEHGVIHRDIKPANMMLTPAGVLKLMDFGIAKAASSADLTRTGTTMGSLHYMSPEQVRGTGEVDRRSDLYSMGVTLYQMCTGARPFEGSSDFEIMSAHLEKEPPPPVSIDPGLPRDLNDLILMSVAKDPEHRFQTAAAFRAALAGVASQVENAPRMEEQPTAAMPSATQVRSQATAAVSGPPQASQAPPQQAQPAPQPGVAGAQQAGPGPAAPPRKSHRGLYMAVGAVLALVLAAFAMTNVAEWFGTSASDEAISAREDAASPDESGLEPAFGEEDTQPQADSEQADADPEADEGHAENRPDPTETAASETTPKEAFAPEQDQAGSSQPPASASSAAQTIVRQDQDAESGAASQIAAQTRRTVESGIQASPAPVEADPAPSTVQEPAQDAAPAVDPEELARLEDLFSKIAIRANVVRSQLGDLEAEQRAQGLSLRGDMAGAKRRMEYLLDQAEAGLNAGDLAAAEKNMKLAERQLGQLESFLGM